MDLVGKKITIVGAARSGIAAAELVIRSGGVAQITDTKPAADIERALAGLQDRASVRVEAGAHTREFLEGSDLVVASPGVWKDALPLQSAREMGIPVWGEIEFAWRFCTKL